MVDFSITCPDNYIWSASSIWEETEGFCFYKHISVLKTIVMHAGSIFFNHKDHLSSTRMKDNNNKKKKSEKKKEEKKERVTFSQWFKRRYGKVKGQQTVPLVTCVMWCTCGCVALYLSHRWICQALGLISGSETESTGTWRAKIKIIHENL